MTNPQTRFLSNPRFLAISYQQNLRDRKLALVVPSTNNWAILKQNIPAVIKAINSAEPGSFAYVTT